MPGKKEKEKRRIIGACFIRLQSLLELGRLACALERAPFPIFAYKHEGKTRLSVQTDLFMGVPIFYYFEMENGSEFLSYRSNGETEDVQLVDATLNPSFIYSPLIHVLKLPKVLEHKAKFSERFLAAEVADLPSLVKIASYKMLYEEPPLPLYTFKNNGKWIIGSFARLDDYEEASLFFYTSVDTEPEHGFVRYAPSRVGDTAFSRRTDEHGFIYVKVIKLAEKHPLVEF